MAGNTRGKIKEELEGIHRNLDWCIAHSQKLLGLIQNKHPKLTESVEMFCVQVQTLDELMSDIYKRV